MNRPKYKELYLEEICNKEKYKDMFEQLIRILKEVNIVVADTKKQSANGFSKIRSISIENNGKKYFIAYEEN